MAAPALQRIGFSTQYRTSNVAKNLGWYLPCTETTDQIKDFEMILTVKMETKDSLRKRTLARCCEAGWSKNCLTGLRPGGAEESTLHCLSTSAIVIDASIDV